MTTYRPGSFFLTAISGPTGFAVGLGQALAGAPSRYSHAGIIVDLTGTTIEAEPGGARYGHVADYAGRPLLISDAPVQSAIRPGRLSLVPPGGKDYESNEDIVRAAVAAEAHSFLGVPYSPLDYAALALLHLHLPSRWIRRRVSTSGHLICSALVDRIYENVGIHLFDDGRLPGDVMPADLAAWAEDWQARQVAA